MSEREREVLGEWRPHRNLLSYYILESFLLGPLFFFILIPRVFRFRTLRYTFDDEGVTMRWGILFRREATLTYERIQDIHLTSNLVQRWLGLGTVQLQTASGTASAEITIEGLQAFELIRDYLYSRMRGVAASEVEKTASIVAGQGTDDLSIALHEIAAELHQLRAELARPQREDRAVKEAGPGVAARHRAARAPPGPPRHHRLFPRRPGVLRIQRPDVDSETGWRTARPPRLTRLLRRPRIRRWSSKCPRAFPGQDRGRGHLRHRTDYSDFSWQPSRSTPAAILLFFESLAIGTFTTQLLFTGLLLKLNWELRWYMLGDESHPHT